MYVDLDFILALIKEEDWLSKSAEEIYEENKGELWTSDFTLLELMLVAYREEKNVVTTLVNAEALIEVKGEPDDMLVAANYVEREGFTPFDALHLVKAGDDGAQGVMN
ncbi:MAG: PIN domain-containing protein [Candidatus Natronoplasma sp.]